VAEAEAVSDPARDLDNSYWLGRPAAVPERGVAAVAAVFADGSALAWRRGTAPIVAGDELMLRFTMLGPDGAPAPLEPYMGMLAHAAVARRDGRVFVHLHPSGSISMAAQQVLRAADSLTFADVSGLRPPPVAPDMTGSHAVHAAGGAAPADAAAPATAVTIPYAFPEPGRYRMFVQVKRAGAVRTAAFDVTVASR
jgi:hypothetical protein